jgi:hypothetical protein
MFSLYILKVYVLLKMEDNLKFNLQMYGYNTRSENNLFIQGLNTARYQNSVINMATKLCNKSPERIRILNNFRCFKKELKL